MTEDEKIKDTKIFYEKIEPIEPHLGLAWSFVIFLIYLFVRYYPAPRYSFIWWFDIYIIVLIAAVTAFALIKRYQYIKDLKKRKLR